MKKEKISAIIYEMVLVNIGLFGIVSIPLTCVVPEVSPWLAVSLSAIIAIFWIGILHLSEKYQLAGTAVVLLGTALYVWINYETLKESMGYVIHAFVEEARKESGIIIELGDLGEGKTFHLSLLIVVIILVGFLVAVEVVWIRNMIVAIVEIVPFLALFITFSIIPEMISFLTCILYVFGAATLSRKRDQAKTGYIVMGAGLVIYFCLRICIPKEGFVRREYFNVAYEKVEQIVSQVSDTLLGTNAPGGINYGQLGKINEIRFSDQPIATVTTVATGRNQYFKTFTGTIYDSDQWRTETTDQENVTLSLFNMMDASEELQTYLTGESGESYYNHTKLYHYYLKENAQNQTKNYPAYSIAKSDYSAYKRFADSQEQINVSYGLENSGLLHPYQFVEYENSYRKQVYNKYCEISDETHGLMVDIIGIVHVDTYDEKVAYINRVKSYLDENYTYTLSPGRVPNEKDFLEYFLKENKTGYCTYFATAATEMFRYVGIPARYCEGYVLTNDEVQNGITGLMQTERYTTEDAPSSGARMIETVNEMSYTVEMTDRNAHAWVEVYMDGYGWIPVEVTPGRSQKDAFAQSQIAAVNNNSSALQADTEKETSTPAQTQDETVTNGASDASTNEETQMDSDNDGIGGNNGAGDNNKGNVFHINTTMKIMAGLFFVLLFVTFILNLRRKRIQSHRQQILEESDEEQTEEQILDLYVYFEKLLGSLGYHKPMGMDYEQYIQMIEIRDEELAKCQISKVMGVLLKLRFSGKSKPTKKEKELIKNTLEQIRKLVYMRSKGAHKLKIRYIDVL